MMSIISQLICQSMRSISPHECRSCPLNVFIELRQCESQKISLHTEITLCKAIECSVMDIKRRHENPHQNSPLRSIIANFIHCLIDESIAQWAGIVRVILCIGNCLRVWVSIHESHYIHSRGFKHTLFDYQKYCCDWQKQAATKYQTTFVGIFGARCTHTRLHHKIQFNSNILSMIIDWMSYRVPRAVHSIDFKVGWFFCRFLRSWFDGFYELSQSFNSLFN